MTTDEGSPFAPYHAAFAEQERRTLARERGEITTYPDWGGYDSQEDMGPTAGEKAGKAVLAGALATIFGLAAEWFIDVSTQQQGRPGVLSSWVGPENTASPNFFWTRIILGNTLALGVPTGLITYAASGRRRK